MRQTVPTILLARNDVVIHDGQYYRVIATHILPCEIYPKLIVVADSWPHGSQRVQIDLDAGAWIARATGIGAVS